MDYEMFTDAGNALVGDIEAMALKYQLSWTTVQGILSAVAHEEAFSEVADTAVREAVYHNIFL